jgi:hypothetical protein
MSDAQDVAAIQSYLKNAQPQAAAFVASSTTTDTATKVAWYNLATRVLHFVSGDYLVTSLADARALRDEFNAMVERLSPDLAARIAQAPPPVVAPPSGGTPNPLFGWLSTAKDLAPLLLVGLIVFELEGKH